MSAIVEFTVRLDGVAGGFAERLAAEEDYDAGVMEAARDVLVRDAFGAAFVPPGYGTSSIDARGSEARREEKTAEDRRCTGGMR